MIEGGGIYMIANVVLVGRVGEVKNEQFRYLEIERNDPFTGEQQLSLIPITTWSYGTMNNLNGLKYGILLVVTGRLEQTEAKGMYVCAERVQYVAHDPTSSLTDLKMK
jgi:hypothetical protein